MTNLVEFPAGGALKMRVAEEVRVLMTRNKVKQSDLAAVLGVKQPQVSQRLNGHVEFTVSELDMLARFFGVPPAALLGVSVRPGGGPDGGRYAMRDLNPQPADLGDVLSDLLLVA